MDTINSTNMTTGAPVDGGDDNNLFQDCSGSQAGTTINAEFLNGVMMELVNTIIKSGQTPIAFDADDPASYDQLYQAIVSIVGAAVPTINYDQVTAITHNLTGSTLTLTVTNEDGTQPTTAIDLSSLGGSSGLSSVASDGTIDGDGTAGNPQTINCAGVKSKCGFLDGSTLFKSVLTPQATAGAPANWNNANARPVPLPLKPDGSFWNGSVWANLGGLNLSGINLANPDETGNSAACQTLPDGIWLIEHEVPNPPFTPVLRYQIVAITSAISACTGYYVGPTGDDYFPVTWNNTSAIPTAVGGINFTGMSISSHAMYSKAWKIG